MQQIADWLDELGLVQYAKRFAENGIDISVLPDLKDEDFDRLPGITRLEPEEPAGAPSPDERDDGDGHGTSLPDQR